MKNLILTRGLPGSGKSTFGEVISTNVLSADKFFEKDGQYNFDPTKLKEAHQWCKDECGFLMSIDTPLIVCCNTFTQYWELKHYYDMADQYGYRVFSIICENRHSGINQHGVPEDKLEIMRKRFEIKI